MCPACIATLAIWVGSAVSSGGVTALLASKLRLLRGLRGWKGRVEKSNQKERTCQKQPTSK
jgi:hypothetical protein